MPAKHRIKTYSPTSYYHVYNRGVEKQIIFKDEQDYLVLMSYLKSYLLPKDTIHLQSIILNPQTSWKEKDEAKKYLQLNNFSETIKLICFCLMPNHYHLLVWQKEKDSMDLFMNSLWTRYTMYFNKKYKRVGPLCQSVYKAVSIHTDEQLLHLSRYIHRNPIAKRHFRNPASQGLALRSYFYSSYLKFISLRKFNWVYPDPILEYFDKNQSKTYANFVESLEIEENSIEIISQVIIENF